MALTLAVVGVDATTTFVVGQRTREWGIRIAMGASPRQLLRLVLCQGATLILLGAIFGVGGAAALSRVLSGLLFEITATDPWTFQPPSHLPLSHMVYYLD